MFFPFARASRAVSAAIVLFASTFHSAQASEVILPIRAEIGASIQLDPTDSIQWMAGQLLRPEWNWITRPGTSVADFDDVAALRPNFTPDVSGTWIAEIALFDASDPAATTPLSTQRVTISTGNLPPVALIQARGLPDGQTPLVLDGTPSYDVDGDALTYAWSIISAPTGHTATFSNVNSAISEFSFDIAGTYTIGLAVQDAAGVTSDTATFDIDVAGGGGDLDLEATLETFNLVTRAFFGQQEVEGRTFVGSTLQNVNGQFGFAPAQDGQDFDELYVDGDLQNSNINLTPGDIAKISGVRINSNVNNGSLVENATDVPAFDFQVFRDQSAFLSGLTGVAADLSDQNNKRFGGAPNAIASEAQFGPNTRIVEATLQDLQSGGYSIDLSQADTVIINVSGTSGNFQMNPLGGTGFAENVIWNFYEATNINVNSVIVGHILAPYARMTGFSGSSEGSVIADDVQLTNGELHQRAWLGTVPAPLGGAGTARSVAPVASLRFDQFSTDVGVPLLIEPFASTDLDGDRLTTVASIISAPNGATPTLTVDGAGVATFTPDTAGEYLVGYEVSDGRSVSTDQVLISVDAGNLRPVARIGDIQNATIGVTSILDGTQSYNLDGDLLSYEWSLLHAPVGSTAALGNTASPLGSLTPDLAGLYVVQLNVADDTAAGVPMTLALVVDAPLPVANAGPDQLPDGAGQAILDGGLSSGGALNYIWSPRGSAGGSSLDDATLVTPLLTLPSQTSELRVAIGTQTVYEIRRNDLGGLCTFDVRTPADIANPASSGWHGIAFWANGKVTVDGIDRPVWVIDNQRDFTRNVVLEASNGTGYGTFTVPGRARAYVTTDPLANGAQMRVLLDGNQVGQASPQSWTFNRTDAVCSGAGTEVIQLVVSDANGISLPTTVFVGDTNLRPVLTRAADLTLQGGETADLSATGLGFDANGDPLTYTWSLIHRPGGSAATIDVDPAIVKVTAETIQFTPDLPGVYTIQLETTDGSYIGEPVTFSISVTGSPPVASALTPADTFVGDIATLDGSASSDPAGDALTFNWTIISAPAGSTATIPDPFGPISTFVPDVRGAYTFQLEVADATLSDTVQVTLLVPNRAPVAELNGPVEVIPGAENVYSALGSSDLDGDELNYSFTVTSAPDGSAFTLVDLSAGEAGFVADVVGSYVLEVAATDGATTETASLVIEAIVQNSAPVLGDIQSTYTVELGLEFALDLTATDPDGDSLTFFATPLPLASGITLDATSGSVRFRPETGQVGTYVFTIGASDGILTTATDLTIEVVAGTASDTSVFGRVLDANDFANGIETPLSGIPVRLRDAALMDITDASGLFDFGSLTAGRDQVLVEPSADGGPGGYISSLRNITITENQNRDLAPDFLLTPLNDGCVQVVAGVATVLNGTTSGVIVNIDADTIQNGDGSLYDGEVCLGALPQLFDHPGFADGTQACNIYALDASGASFTTGATLTAPNVDQLPDGARLVLQQSNPQNGLFRPTTDAFVDPGAVTVSAGTNQLNGSVLFTFLPQNPNSIASSDQPVGNRTLTMFNGDLNEVYSLHGYQAFSEKQYVGLSYHSQAADPTILVAGDVTIAADASLPVQLQTVLDIGGLSFNDGSSWTPRTGLNGETPALIGEELTLRQASTLDASGLDDGRYGYTFRSEAQYACSTVSSQHEAELYVQNTSDSPYGKGWSIDGLQKLNVSPDGKVSIIDDDSVVTFDPEPTLTEFEDEPLVFPSIGGQDLIIEDFNGNGRLDVAVAETGPGDIFVIENFGGRDFSIGSRVNVETPIEVPPTGAYPPNLLAMGGGDFNADGIIDLAHSGQFSDRIGTAINDGFGNFDPRNFATFGNLRDLVVADLDGDGLDDVTVGRFNGFFGIGNGEIFTIWGGPVFSSSRIGVFAFGRNPLELRAEDVDGDGRLDIAHRTDRGVNFSYNNGNRNFTSARTQLGGTTQNLLGEYMRFSDLDGDGRKEMIYSTNSQLRVFPNTSGRGFGAPTVLARPTSIGSAGFIEMVDANGDGNDDILLSSGNSVFVYLGNGDGTFQPFEDGFLDRGSNLTKVADLDGDGSLDLITAQRFTVTIFFSKPGGSGRYIAGAGEFSELTEIPGGGWLRRYKDGTTVEFDANGFQTALIDTQGNRQEYTYDAEGRVLTMTDQVGGVSDFAYDDDGRLATITYPDGRVNEFTYDVFGQLESAKDFDEEVARYSYDEDGRLVGFIDERGDVTTHTYDPAGDYKGTLYPDGSAITTKAGNYLGVDLSAPQPAAFVAPEDRVTVHTDERGETSEVTVNEFGAIIRSVDAIGRETIYTRDDENLVTRLVRPKDASPSGIRTDEMTYDDRGNMLSLTSGVGTAIERTRSYEYEPEFSKVTKFTDFDGFESTYAYDVFGELELFTDALGNTRSYQYNQFGLMITMTDENGNLTTYEYNPQLNLAVEGLPDGSRREYTYDTRGNVIEYVEAVGTPVQRTYVREYDILNRMLSEEVLDATGTSLDGRRFYEYDPIDNMTAYEDETGLRTEYVYDDMSREISASDPAYGTTTSAYDIAGELIAETDAEGITQTWEYDVVNRIVATNDGIGNRSLFTYDVADNLIRVDDARGNVTTFGFDIFDRRIRRTNPLSQTITMGYDNRDNLTQITRETGDIETATYDGLSRRLSVTTPDNTLTFGYDPYSNLTAANDDDSALTMAYDSRHRLTQVATDGTVGPQPASTITYTYDEISQRRTMTDHLAAQWTYNFDEKSRVTSITSPWGDTHSMDYDDAGRRLELANTTGRLTQASWSSDRLAQLEHFQNNTPVARSGYDYTPDGSLGLIRDLETPAKSETLFYDGINRLLQVAEGVPTTDGGTPIPTEDYAYDPVGNRTSSHISTGYAVDDHNRLLSTDEFTYTYDEKGNRITRTRLTDGVVETYSYNSMNQLIGVTSTAGLDAEYHYDALGRRIAKRVGADTTAYVYDIGNMRDITAHDVLLEYENATLDKRWLNGQQIDEPVAFEGYGADITAGSGTAYALHGDRQGSIIAVIEQATGTVAARYEYDAFGQREVLSGAGLQDYGFTGREFDDETGLYYYRARHFDPGPGRFLQSDPLGFAAGDLNLYAYTWNDPANWTDPSGLIGKNKGGGFAGLTLAAAGIAAKSAKTVGKGALCLAGKVSSALQRIGQLLDAGLSFDKITEFGSRGTASCKTRIKAKKEENECKTSYRVTSEAELDDILQNDIIRPNGSMEDKWFWESLEDAREFQDKMNLNGEPIIEVEIPNEIIDNAYHNPNVDNIGPGNCVKNGDLPNLPGPTRVIR